MMGMDMWQNRLLKSDNDRMFADLDGWRTKNGLVGKDLDRINYGDFGGQEAAGCDEVEKTLDAGTSATLAVRTKYGE
jgi:hypothetical protein